MVFNTQVIGKTTNHMIKMAFKIILMEANILEGFSMVKNKVKVNTFGLMEKYTPENLIMD